jgi:4-hydroxy-tetrahydrodipicolinate synthase
MTNDGAVDGAKLKALVEFHITEGTDAIVAVGTTGEASTLTADEHCYVIESIIKVAKGRIPVIAGTGSNSTTEAILLTQKAQKLGVEACLLVTPYYNKPTQQGLYKHYATIAATVKVPLILYNVPQRTGCDLLPETIATLANITNIIGIKEATGDLKRVKQLRELCGDEFALYSGDDVSSREFCLAGGNGTITVTGNVAPNLVHKMIMAAIAGNRETALAVDAKLIGLHQQLFIQSSPIPVKWAMAKMQLIESGIRLPLTPLSAECFDAVEQAMHQAAIS